MATHVETPPATADLCCLTTNLGWLLDSVATALAKELAPALEPLGLGSRGFCVLGTALEGGHTQIELAKAIGMDKTTMVVTLDQLEAAGLVERRPSSTDRRVRVIEVTRAGRRKHDEARRIVAEVQSDMLARLPARERDALMSGLRQMVS